MLLQFLPANTKFQIPIIHQKVQAAAMFLWILGFANKKIFGNSFPPNYDYVHFYNWFCAARQFQFCRISAKLIVSGPTWKWRQTKLRFLKEMTICQFCLTFLTVRNFVPCAYDFCLLMVIYISSTTYPSDCTYILSLIAPLFHHKSSSY